jgi:hypothetical protein
LILSISDTQHNNAFPCAECRYAEWRILFTIILSAIAMNVIMLNVVMLNVVMLNVVMLSVVVPKTKECRSFAETQEHPLYPIFSSVLKKKILSQRIPKCQTNFFHFFIYDKKAAS